MDTPALAPRRRMRPALGPTLAAIAGVALFIVAGNWQRDRMEQRLALRAQFDPVLKSGGPDGLEANLRQRAEKALGGV